MGSTTIGTKGPFPKLIHISDVHTYHPVVPFSNIVESFDTVLPKDKDLALIDVITITGDFFDKTIPFNDEMAIDFYCWATGFLRLCQFHNIRLIILEGTPRHDRKQSRWFVEINRESGINADVVYLDGLGIYNCDRTGKSFGYISDEYTADPKDSYIQFKQLLLEKGLDKVDIMLMHCMFDFQSPIDHPDIKTHDSDAYIALVNDYIVSGHIHTPQLYKGVICVVGSLTRLRHGECEKKGCFYSTFTASHIFKLTFIENTSAMIFTNLHFKSENGVIDLDKVRDQILALSYREGSHLQIVVDEADSHLLPISYFNQLRPDFIWAKKVVKPEIAKKKETIGKDEVTFSLVEITAENILSILENRLRERLNDEIDLDKHLKFLSGVIDEHN